LKGVVIRGTLNVHFYMTYIISAIVAVIVVVSGGFALNHYYTTEYDPIDIEIVEPKERTTFVSRLIRITQPKPSPTRTSTPRPTPAHTSTLTPPFTPAIDRIAPVISGVGISSVTSTGATVSWTTNEPANTQVEYGFLNTYGSLTSLNNTLSTSHSVQLSGLTAGRAYHVRVRSIDASGNLSIGSDYTLNTTAVAVVKKIDIDDIEVETGTITTTSAIVKWSTEIAADGQVEYGTTTSYASSTPLVSALSTDHTVTLSTLLPNTTYHYRVRSKTSTVAVEISRDYTFKTNATADTTAPTLGAITVTDITQTSVKVNWTTNEPATASVEWGLQTSYGIITPNADTNTLSHLVSLIDLEAGKTYNYRAISKDAANNTTRSANAMFVTTAPPPAADTTAPLITNVQTDSSPTSVTVIWTTEEAADSLVKFRQEGGENGSWGEFSDVAKVTTHNMVVNDLQPSITYEVEIYSTDAAGNISEKVAKIIQTQAEEVPAP
jgi:hypothetical protein